MAALRLAARQQPCGVGNPGDYQSVCMSSSMRLTCPPRLIHRGGYFCFAGNAACNCTPW
jgi:hypothetical protein